MKLSLVLLATMDFISLLNLMELLLVAHAPNMTQMQNIVIRTIMEPMKM